MEVFTTTRGHPFIFVVLRALHWWVIVSTGTISKNRNSIFNFWLCGGEKRRLSTWDSKCPMSPNSVHEQNQVSPLLSDFSKASWALRLSDSNGTSVYSFSWSAGAGRGAGVCSGISTRVWAFIPKSGRSDTEKTQHYYINQHILSATENTRPNPSMTVSDHWLTLPSTNIRFYLFTPGTIPWLPSYWLALDSFRQTNSQLCQAFA